MHEAALAYLARYAATETGLRRVLVRRIDRWTRAAAERDDARECAAAAKRLVPAIVARMVALGAVDDAAYAQTKARALALSGRSRLGIAARLAAKGVGAAQVRAALPADELVAALILARKRRIGPYSRDQDGDMNKQLAVLARAGFPREVAARALRMDAETAEAAIDAARA